MTIGRDVAIRRLWECVCRRRSDDLPLSLEEFEEILDSIILSTEIPEPHFPTLWEIIARTISTGDHIR